MPTRIALAHVGQRRPGNITTRRHLPQSSSACALTLCRNGPAYDCDPTSRHHITALLRTYIRRKVRSPWANHPEHLTLFFASGQLAWVLQLGVKHAARRDLLILPSRKVGPWRARRCGGSLAYSGRAIRPDCGVRSPSITEKATRTWGACPSLAVCTRLTFHFILAIIPREPASQISCHRRRIQCTAVELLVVSSRCY